MVHRYGQRSPTTSARPTPSGSAQTCHAGIGAANLLADAGHDIPTALLLSLLTSALGTSAALGVIEVISEALDAARPG
jgi:hypothetical protein